MSSATVTKSPKKSRLRPAWDIAKLFPAKGCWSEEDYLDLDGNRLVEFTHGHVEVLPTPTEDHQMILAFLYEAMLLSVRPRKLGRVVFAGLPLRLLPGKLREPDLLFLSAGRSHLRGNSYWKGADLVMEVVSKHGVARDTRRKRVEYARAGIPEYWIVDPHLRQITVLSLGGKNRYEVHGVFKEGDRATSALLPEFGVDVREALTAGSPDERGFHPSV